MIYVYFYESIFFKINILYIFYICKLNTLKVIDFYILNVWPKPCLKRFLNQEIYRWVVLYFLGCHWLKKMYILGCFYIFLVVIGIQGNLYFLDSVKN